MSIEEIDAIAARKAREDAEYLDWCTWMNSQPRTWPDHKKSTRWEKILNFLLTYI